MNMEQKTFYVAPKAEFSAAKIRCSILAGSNGQNSEVKPTNPSSSVGGDDVGFDTGNGNGARERKGTLGF